LAEAEDMNPDEKEQACAGAGFFAKEPERKRPWCGK
jgi:hypothetical protein